MIQLQLYDNISISSSGSSSHNVLVKRERYEYDDDQEVHHGANSPHGLRTSFLCTFDISFPFNPAFINVGPSHLIIEYVAEKAIPLKARDAMRGSPSPRKVLAIIPSDARNKDSKVIVSVKESEEAVEVVIGVYRTTEIVIAREQDED